MRVVRSTETRRRRKNGKIVPSPKSAAAALRGGAVDLAEFRTNKGQRVAQNLRASAFHADGLGDMAAKCPRAWNRVEQADHVAQNGNRPRTRCDLALQIGDHRLGCEPR